jgi:hypothetical protein
VTLKQAWHWAPDGSSYQLDHLILEEAADGWRCRSRRTPCRALLRAQLAAAARVEGLADGTRLMPDQTGFYQPIFQAVRR